MARTTAKRAPSRLKRPRLKRTRSEKPRDNPSALDVMETASHVVFGSIALATGLGYLRLRPSHARNRELAKWVEKRGSALDPGAAIAKGGPTLRDIIGDTGAYADWDDAKAVLVKVLREGGLIRTRSDGRGGRYLLAA